jgi:hypothetical protein
MAIVKTKHFVQVEFNLIERFRIELMEPDIYQDIQNEVGIYNPTLIYDPQLRLSVGELRKNGLIQKLLVRTETGRNHVIVCATPNLSTALAKLVGKKIPEQSGTSVEYKKITKVSIPRKRTRV